MSFRVLAQVSCEVTSPKQQRPSDGVLFVNVELSPMASPAFEAGRWVMRSGGRLSCEYNQLFK